MVLVIGKKVIRKHKSKNNTAIASNGERLLVGWTGIHKGKLNFAGTTDAKELVDEQVLPHTSSAGIGLTYWRNDRVKMFAAAWVASKNDRRIRYMLSTDGSDLAEKEPRVFEQSYSEGIPGVTRHLGALWFAFANRRRHVRTKRVRVTPSGPVRYEDDAATDVVVDGNPVLSEKAVGIVGGGNQDEPMLVAYVEAGSGQVKVVRSQNGDEWDSIDVATGYSTQQPGLLWNGSRRRYTLAWTEWQGKEVHMKHWLLDEDVWTETEALGETSHSGPGLAVLQGQTVLSWTGTDENNRPNLRVLD